MNLHIEHFNISAPFELLKEIKYFYCYLFNLKEGFRPQFSKKGFWLYSDKKPLIHLTESNEHFYNKKQSYLDHIAFQTIGLKEMKIKLKKLNAEFESDHLPEIGMTQLFFRDPAGIRLEANFLNE